jgi:hypothetical protein
MSEAHEAMDQSVGYRTLPARWNRPVDKGLTPGCEKFGQSVIPSSVVVETNEVGAGRLDVTVGPVANGALVHLTQRAFA